MTTIAYRDGIMAADGGAWIGDAAVSGGVRKVAKGSDGRLHAVCGNVAEACGYLRWVDAGCQGEPPKPRDLNHHNDDRSSFCAIIAEKGKPILVMTAHGFEEYDLPYFAFGSGKEVAFGALFVGASALQALEAAAEHGSCCVQPFQSVSFD